jgi:hypothetical protein
MAVSFKVEDVNISAIRDRAMFNTFAGDLSYVIEDIGDELEVTYSNNSFVVTLGTGEAVICGGSMVSEGVASAVTLGTNESGYIVIEVDLSQTGANICQFKNVASLVQNDINDGSSVLYDFPLYAYTTDGNGVSSMTDMRVITRMNPLIRNLKILEITSTSFNSLPQTINDAAITADHVVLNSVLSNPSAQTGDWTVTTSAGSLTISGTISGSTTITLYLGIKQ